MGRGMTQTGGPPAGWYPDPAGGTGWRWWDGDAWTAHVRAGLPRTPQSPPGAHGTTWSPGRAGMDDAWVRRQLAAPYVDRAARLGRLAKVSVVVVAAVGVLAVVLPIVYSSALATLFHWFHEAFDAAEAVPRRTPPPIPELSASYVRFAYLGDLAYCALGVVFLVWQYRAADAARRLGIPAHHRPGWGVAFWFIPLANLWCPYQALRDCLPPGHRSRRTAAWCWVAYLFSGVLVVAVAATAPYHRGIAVAALAAQVAVLAFVAASGVRLVGAVGRAHQELLTG